MVKLSELIFDQPEGRAKTLEAVPGGILDALTVELTGTGVARVLLDLAEFARKLRAAVTTDALLEGGRVEDGVLVLGDRGHVDEGSLGGAGALILAGNAVARVVVHRYVKLRRVHIQGSA